MSIKRICTEKINPEYERGEKLMEHNYEHILPIDFSDITPDMYIGNYTDAAPLNAESAFE